MSKKNLLSGRDKELQELAEQYEAAQKLRTNLSIWMQTTFSRPCRLVCHAQKKQQATEVVEYGLRLHPNSTPLLVEQAYLFMDAQKKEIKPNRL